jgi:hypothetical protein
MLWQKTNIKQATIVKCSYAFKASDFYCTKNHEKD